MAHHHHPPPPSAVQYPAAAAAAAMDQQRQHDGAADDDDVCLPSFPALRRRTLQALYYYGRDDARGSVVDKSPKGSVDEHIQGLVDCINRHESYATLSSCSGRIALYDPGTRVELSSEEAAREQRKSTVNDEEKPTTKNSSGKGAAGRWLLVSHDEIDASDLLQHFDGSSSTTATTNGDNRMDDSSTSVCSFRFEPMLLHVAACHLQAGRTLLQIAVQNGFRESGLMVTPQRVTVAIRTHALALTVPVATTENHPLRPADVYLAALVAQANDRLRRNLEKLAALHRAILESELFLTNESNNKQNLQAAVIVSSKTRLPDLNLHGHATVAVPTGVPRKRREKQDSSSRQHQNADTDVHLLVFGGYGPGPPHDAESSPPPPSRSAAVYSLRRSVEGSWDDAWSRVALEKDHKPTSGGETLSIMNGYEIEAAETEWGARQGVAAVSLGDDSVERKSLVLLFGGRLGPTKPLDGLLVFVYNAAKETGNFRQPCHVQGQPPAPRWGHTLTALSRSSAQGVDQQQQQLKPISIALLAGGRNENSTSLGESSLYLLSLVTTNSDSRSAHFLWESLVDDSTAPSASILDLCRFNHVAVSLKENRVLIFGGLHSVDDLLESFGDASVVETDDEQEDCSDAVAILVTLRSSRKRHGDDSKGTAHSATMEKISCSAALSPRFGHAACLLASNTMGTTVNGSSAYTILLSGGVTMAASNREDKSRKDEPALQFMQLHSRPLNGSTKKLAWCLETLPSEPPGDLNLGCLVHHSCLRLSARTPSSTTSDEANDSSVVLTGGGVAGFAFQQSFAPSSCLTMRLSLRDGETDRVGKKMCIAGAGKIANPATRKDSAYSAASTEAPVCAVVYVHKPDAKELKTALEEALLLDKTHRMTAVDEKGIVELLRVDIEADAVESSCIAVPVHSGCLEILRQDETESEWVSLVVGSGQQVCPHSSGAFARGSPKKSKGR